jgi:hypothetical protein
VSRSIFVPNWKRKLRHAWSCRLGFGLAAIAGANAGAGFAADGNWKGAALVAVVGFANGAAPLFAQRKVTGHGEG